MAISIDSLIPVNQYYKTTPERGPKPGPLPKEDFATVFDAAKNLIVQTNNMQIESENEMTKFLLGEADNAHDAMIAGQKATIALQYTNAIRNNVIQAYQSIMQIQV